LLDEGELEHAPEIFGCFLEASKDASRFLKPADQALDDAAPAISFAVERGQPVLAVVGVFAGNDWLNSQFEQIVVDPVGSISFVAGQGDRPGIRPAILIDQFRVGANE